MDGNGLFGGSHHDGSRVPVVAQTPLTRRSRFLVDAEGVLSRSIEEQLQAVRAPPPFTLRTQNGVTSPSLGSATGSWVAPHAGTESERRKCREMTSRPTPVRSRPSSAHVSSLTPVVRATSRPSSAFVQHRKQEFLESMLTPVHNFVGLTDQFIQRPQFHYRPLSAASVAEEVVSASRHAHAGLPRTHRPRRNVSDNTLCPPDSTELGRQRCTPQLETSRDDGTSNQCDHDEAAVFFDSPRFAHDNGAKTPTSGSRVIPSLSATPPSHRRTEETGVASAPGPARRTFARHSGAGPKAANVVIVPSDAHVPVRLRELVKLMRQNPSPSHITPQPPSRNQGSNLPAPTTSLVRPPTRPSSAPKSGSDGSPRSRRRRPHSRPASSGGNASPSRFLKAASATGVAVGASGLDMSGSEDLMIWLPRRYRHCEGCRTPMMPFTFSSPSANHRSSSANRPRRSKRGRRSRRRAPAADAQGTHPPTSVVPPTDRYASAAANAESPPLSGTPSDSVQSGFDVLELQHLIREEVLAALDERARTSGRAAAEELLSDLHHMGLSDAQLAAFLLADRRAAEASAPSGPLSNSADSSHRTENHTFSSAGSDARDSQPPSFSARETPRRMDAGTSMTEDVEAQEAQSQKDRSTSMTLGASETNIAVGSTTHRRQDGVEVAVQATLSDSTVSTASTPTRRRDGERTRRDARHHARSSPEKARTRADVDARELLSQHRVTAKPKRNKSASNKDKVYRNKRRRHRPHDTETLSESDNSVSLSSSSASVSSDDSSGGRCRRCRRRHRHRHMSGDDSSSAASAGTCSSTSVRPRHRRRKHTSRKARRSSPLPSSSSSSSLQEDRLRGTRQKTTPPTAEGAGTASDRGKEPVSEREFSTSPDGDRLGAAAETTEQPLLPHQLDSRPLLSPSVSASATRDSGSGDACAAHRDSSSSSSHMCHGDEDDADDELEDEEVGRHGMAAGAQQQNAIHSACDSSTSSESADLYFRGPRRGFEPELLSPPQPHEGAADTTSHPRETASRSQLSSDDTPDRRCDTTVQFEEALPMYNTPLVPAQAAAEGPVLTKKPQWMIPVLETSSDSIAAANQSSGADEENDEESGDSDDSGDQVDRKAERDLNSKSATSTSTDTSRNGTPIDETVARAQLQVQMHSVLLLHAQLSRAVVQQEQLERMGLQSTFRRCRHLVERLCELALLENLARRYIEEEEQERWDDLSSTSYQQRATLPTLLPPPLPKSPSPPLLDRAPSLNVDGEEEKAETGSQHEARASGAAESSSSSTADGRENSGPRDERKAAGELSGARSVPEANVASRSTSTGSEASHTRAEHEAHWRRAVEDLEKDEARARQNVCFAEEFTRPLLALHIVEDEEQCLREDTAFFEGMRFALIVHEWNVTAPVTFQDSSGPSSPTNASPVGQLRVALNRPVHETPLAAVTAADNESTHQSSLQVADDAVPVAVADVSVIQSAATPPAPALPEGDAARQDSAEARAASPSSDSTDHSRSDSDDASPDEANAEARQIDSEKMTDEKPSDRDISPAPQDAEELTSAKEQTPILSAAVANAVPADEVSTSVSRVSSTPSDHPDHAAVIDAHAPDNEPTALADSAASDGSEREDAAIVTQAPGKAGISDTDNDDLKRAERALSQEPVEGLRDDAVPDAQESEAKAAPAPTVDSQGGAGNLPSDMTGALSGEPSTPPMTGIINDGVSAVDPSQALPIAEESDHPATPPAEEKESIPTEVSHLPDGNEGARSTPFEDPFTGECGAPPHHEITGSGLIHSGTDSPDRVVPSAQHPESPREGTKSDDEADGEDETIADAPPVEVEAPYDSEAREPARGAATTPEQESSHATEEAQTTQGPVQTDEVSAPRSPRPQVSDDAAESKSQLTSCTTTREWKPEHSGSKSVDDDDDAVTPAASGADASPEDVPPQVDVKEPDTATSDVVSQTRPDMSADPRSATDDRVVNRTPGGKVPEVESQTTGADAPDGDSTATGSRRRRPPPTNRKRGNDFELIETDEAGELRGHAPATLERYAGTTENASVAVNGGKQTCPTPAQQLDPQAVVGESTESVKSPRNPSPSSPPQRAADSGNVQESPGETSPVAGGLARHPKLPGVRPLGPPQGSNALGHGDGSSSSSTHSSQRSLSDQPRPPLRYTKKRYKHAVFPLRVAPGANIKKDDKKEAPLDDHETHTEGKVSGFTTPSSSVVAHIPSVTSSVVAVATANRAAFFRENKDVESPLMRPATPDFVHATYKRLSKKAHAEAPLRNVDFYPPVIMDSEEDNTAGAARFPLSPRIGKGRLPVMLRMARKADEDDDSSEDYSTGSDEEDGGDDTSDDCSPRKPFLPGGRPSIRNHARTSAHGRAGARSRGRAGPPSPQLVPTRPIDSETVASAAKRKFNMVLSTKYVTSTQDVSLSSEDLHAVPMLVMNPISAFMSDESN